MGIRVPKEEQGSYDLNARPRTGVKRVKTVDDGAIQLSADYMQQKFNKSTPIVITIGGGE